MNQSMNTHLISYRYDGESYVMEVVASDPEDAKRRLSAAAAWGVVDGNHATRIPVRRGGFMVPLVAWLRNRIKV